MNEAVYEFFATCLPGAEKLLADAAKRSQMASFTFKATNWVLRSSALVPLARTAMLASSGVTAPPGSPPSPRACRAPRSSWRMSCTDSA